MESSCGGAWSHLVSGPIPLSRRGFGDWPASSPCERGNDTQGGFGRSNQRGASTALPALLFSAGISRCGFWLFLRCPLTKTPKPPPRKPPPTFETPFFGLLLPSSDLLRLSIFYHPPGAIATDGAAADVAAPRRPNARADAARGHGPAAAFDLNKLLVLGSHLPPLRQGHRRRRGRR